MLPYSFTLQQLQLEFGSYRTHCSLFAVESVFFSLHPRSIEPTLSAKTLHCVEMVRQVLRGRLQHRRRGNSSWKVRRVFSCAFVPLPNCIICMQKYINLQSAVFKNWHLKSCVGKSQIICVCKACEPKVCFW